MDLFRAIRHVFRLRGRNVETRMRTSGPALTNSNPAYGSLDGPAASWLTRVVTRLPARPVNGLRPARYVRGTQEWATLPCLGNRCVGIYQPERVDQQGPSRPLARFWLWIPDR